MPRRHGGLRQSTKPQYISVKIRFFSPISSMIQDFARQTARDTAAEAGRAGDRQAAPALSAPCPKCRAEMVYVTALPHPHAPEMRRTVFLCAWCNQTRNYSLSAAMAEAYAALAAPQPADAAAP